jgi:hypothetical protein
MKPFAASAAVRHLVWGPALQVGASLIDLLLATRVFVHADPLVGALSFFLFGATTGLPCQMALARSQAPRSANGRPLTGRTRQWVVAMFAGVLAAASTAAWLYCLGAANPALVFSLANLGPALFALVEGARGKLRWTTATASIALLLSGFWVFRSPDLSAFAGLAPAVILALCIRNLSSAGSEAAEQFVDKNEIVRFNATRFGWLAGAGVPLAGAYLLATSRLDESLVLIRQALPFALPLHMLTMLLTFIGGYLRTSARASGQYSMSLCSAAYAAPLVLAPVVALAANAVFEGLFPSVSGSAHVFVGSVLVVAAVVWLASAKGREQPPATIESGNNL